MTRTTCFKAYENLGQLGVEQYSKVDTPDELSLEFADWRMSIRASNSEPLLRLNIETDDAVELVRLRVDEFEVLIAHQ